MAKAVNKDIKQVTAEAELMHGAIIKDNVVTNVILVSGDGPGWVVVPKDVGIGWTHNNGVFTPPPLPPPAPGELTELDTRITNAPTDLFGGPTLQEIFNVDQDNNRRG